jgi:hypothetical protein
MSQRTKLVIIIVSILVVISGFAWLIAYITSFQYVTIAYSKPEKNVVIELYTTKTDPAEEHGIIASDKVQTVNNNERLRLKKGSYMLKTVGDSYNENQIFFRVGDTEETVGYSLIFSGKVLEDELAAEREKARNVITTEYPTSSELYTFKNEKIMLQGQWYVAYLFYKGKNDGIRDTLRIVLHKENGNWKTATKPQLSLSNAEYPTIPKEVLDYANELLGPPPTATERRAQ